MGTGPAPELSAAGPTVSIRYLSAVREQAGRRRDELPMPAGSTLAAAADWIRAKRGIEVPGKALMCTLNGHGWNQLSEGMATVLRDGDEIAVFPLISGG